MTDTAPGSGTPLPPTMIRYEWPADGIDPFDVTPAETHWFLRTTENSPWGRAWPAGDFRGFGGFGDFVDRVPMGYKGILAYERLAVVSGGRVIRTWPATDTPDVDSSLSRQDGRSPYRIVAQRPIPPSEPPEPDPATAEQAIEATLLRSRQVPDVPMITARCLRHETWH